MAKHQLHPAKFNIYKCQTSFKSLTPQLKTKKLTTKTTKMGDHQHHHPLAFSSSRLSCSLCTFSLAAISFSSCFKKKTKY